MLSLKEKEVDRSGLAETVRMGAGPLYADKYPNTSGLEPVGRAVLVKPYSAKKMGANIPGFTLPDSVRAGLEMVEQRAVVVAVGPSAWHDEPHKRAFPGDHILMTKYAGFEARDDITGDGEVYRLVNDRDVFCKITGPKVEK